MKIIVTLLCCVLSVTSWADIAAPAANYTMTNSATQPTDALGELNDDPQQTSVVTKVEKTTVDNDDIGKNMIMKKEWKGRIDSAMKRRKADPTLR